MSALLLSPHAAPSILMNCWYAVHVASQCEAPVCDALEGHAVTHTNEKGTVELAGAGFSIEAYWPHRETHDRFHRVIRRPWFPGYVFAKFDWRDRARILSTPHVVRIVGATPQYPIAIPDSEIESIRILASSRAQVVKYPYLEPGKPVRVTKGALKGAEGELVRFAGNGTLLVVSIHILGESRAVTIDSELVEPVRSGADALRTRP